MKKNLFVRILALVAALLMLSCAAVAEEIAEAPIGHLPERGMSIPFTAEDAAAGYGASFYMLNTAVFPEKAGLNYTYGVKIICLSTIFSLATLPLMTFVANLIW